MSAPHRNFPDDKRVWFKSPFAPERRHAERAVIELNGHPHDLDQPESEVMPPAEPTEPTRHDTGPPSATEADRLDQIARLINDLTYGEMMDIAAAIWEAVDGKEITAETLAAILHTWSKKHG